MADTKCKTCRRVGQKLFLKEDKCLGPKCPISRKPYPPGIKAKKMRSLSEYGRQLKEKQKLKFLYGLKERQFSKYVKEAMKRGGSNIGLYLLNILESRLDNAVFRLGLTNSRSAGRQVINHGHISVNNKRVTIPSFGVKRGDKISIRPQSISKKVFQDLDVRLKKYEAPSWLKLNKSKKEGEVVKNPESENIEFDINLNSIIEFYSR